MSKAIVTKADRCQNVWMACGNLTWLVSKELGNSETMTVGRSTIRPGQMNPRHYHPNCDEVLHVLEGTIIHTMDGDEAELTEGDTISIPKNVVHNARNVGTVDALLFICFSSAERQTVWV